MILKEFESQDQANDMTKLLVKELRIINEFKDKSMDRELYEQQQLANMLVQESDTDFTAENPEVLQKYNTII